MIYNENLWNNYAATILKSKITYKTYPTIRGKRYDGNSKMTFTSLMIHGFSALSVYMDLVAIRLMVFSIFTIVISLFLILIVASLKLYTTLTIPGWATNVILILFVILFQSLMFSLLMLFVFLSKRTSKNIIPYEEYKSYIIKILNY